MGSSRTFPNKQAQARKDICYTCHESGHWSKDCPTKTQPVRPQSNDLDLPVVQCPRGHGACAVRTSTTENNPNRKYYQCPRNRSVAQTGFYSTGSCGYFQWCDTARIPEAVPMCPCGAGRCSVRRETAGPNAGRWSFTCRVQKGHGACSFFQWEDAHLNTKTNWYTNNHNVEATHRVVDEESGLRPSKRIKTESSILKHHVPGKSVDLALPLTGIKKIDEPPFTPVHINQPQAVITERDSSGSVLTHVQNSDWNSGSRLLSMNKTLHTPRPCLAELCPRRLDFSPGIAAGDSSTGGSAVSNISYPKAGFVEQSMQAQGGVCDVTGEPSMEEEEELFKIFSVIDYLLEKPQNQDTLEPSWRRSSVYQWHLQRIGPSSVEVEPLSYELLVHIVMVGCFIL